MLVPLFSVENIVTTNWDTNFEDVCGATPIVVPDDYAFWDMPGRKVFKIHGSITNWGSIVATEADYRRCYRRLRDGVIGASLKHLLATKRAVFVGYSLRDEDFSRLYGFLRREMGEVLPRSYIVTLDPRINRATHPDSTVIYTSGEYFLEAIVDRFLEEGRIINPKITRAAARKLDAVYDAHATLDGIAMQEHPEVIYTHSYQDGLIHGSSGS